MSEARVDVAVVGLGAMGSALLDQLAQRGVGAVGFDRFRPPHAQGSSHGETRITRCAVGEGEAYVPLVTRSHQVWRELESETGATLFRPVGTLVVGPETRSGAGASGDPRKTNFVHRTLHVAERAGIAHEALDADAIAARFPFMENLSGTIGCFEPGGGYLHPERCIAAQLDRAERSGAEIRTDAPVLALAPDGTGVRLRTARGDRRAGHVVVAAGAWNAQLLGSPFTRLLTVRRQVLHWFALQETAPIGESDPVYIRAHGLGEGDSFYGFPPLPGERRIKLATEQLHDATDPDGAWHDVDPAESDTLFARHVAGRIAGVRPGAVATAACLYTMTPDHGFIVDRHPEMPAVTVIAACSGHGFKHSAGLGAALADALVGAPTVDLAPFSLRRFG